MRRLLCLHALESNEHVGPQKQHQARNPGDPGSNTDAATLQLWLVAMPDHAERSPLLGDAEQALDPRHAAEQAQHVTTHSDKKHSHGVVWTVGLLGLLLTGAALTLVRAQLLAAMTC